MATLSRSSGHKHDNHDWTSSEYVSHWAEGQDKKEALRQEAFRVIAQTISFDKGLPIKILDVGIDAVSARTFFQRYCPMPGRISRDDQFRSSTDGLL